MPENDISFALGHKMEKLWHSGWPRAYCTLTIYEGNKSIWQVLAHLKTQNMHNYDIQKGKNSQNNLEITYFLSNFINKE